MDSLLFLAGTSHLGKSSSAQQLADKAGCSIQSTDTMGRHPGRPWKGVPDPVLKFYLSLDADAIHWFLKVHHQNLRPLIAQAVNRAKTNNVKTVFEGAALRPEYIPHWCADASAVVLWAKPDLIRERIERASLSASAEDRVQAATRAFVERSLRENDALAEGAALTGLPVLDVSQCTSIAHQVERIGHLLGPPFD